MGFVRLWKKAFKISIREKKSFIVFTLMYTVLIFFTSFSLEMAFKTGAETQGLGNMMFIVALISSMFLTLFYAWIIVRRNSRIWATLKCVGYTSSDITQLIVGGILFTTVMGLFLTFEIVFHYMAIVGYIQAATDSGALVVNLPIITLGPILITVGVFLAVQIIGYFTARGRITKVRPMEALKRVGE